MVGRKTRRAHRNVSLLGCSEPVLSRSVALLSSRLFAESQSRYPDLMKRLFPSISPLRYRYVNILRHSLRAERLKTGAKTS